MFEANLLSGYLDKMDKIQQKAVFNTEFMWWFGGNAKYNQGNYQVADPSSTKMVRSVRDEYVSASFYLTGYWNAAGERFIFHLVLTPKTLMLLPQRPS